MSLFPMFLKLENRDCLVVGAGTIAEPKIRSLLVAGARLRVIAPEARPAVKEWARLGVIAWEERTFEAKDCDGAFLVVAATSLPEVNEAVFSEAKQREVLCNAVDASTPRRFASGDFHRRPESSTGAKTAGRY